MSKLIVTALINLVLGVGLTGYIGHSRANTSQRVPAMVLSPPLVSTSVPRTEETLTFPYEQPQHPPPPPPPPPPPRFPGDPPIKQSLPEPPRTLVGVTRKELTKIELYLPKGAQIYTYPIGENGLAAALVNADIDGDGRDETLVVYNERKPTGEEGSLPLIMTVLARADDRLVVRSSVRLLGDVFFNPKIDGVGGPFVAYDVTGDGRPEIEVVSGGGASVGGAMQVFSFDGLKPREIARIGGHFFRVRTQGAGHVLIEASWKDEGQERIYQWNGKAFEEVSRRTLERR